MPEIKLSKRYPDSRMEDITDSFFRGFNCAVDMAKDSVRRMTEENAKLRELIHILYYCGLPWKDCDQCAMNGADMHVKISDIDYCDGMHDRMRELGVDV